MVITPLLGLVLAVLAPFVDAQQEVYVFDRIHNVTSLGGSWSSGSMAVRTGPEMGNPANLTFNYPANTGIAYSFTDDGYYELTRYRFKGNGSQPTCIIGAITWAHGIYDLYTNNSLVLRPFGDGYQQIQDPCGGVSNFIEPYNITEFYTFRIFEDPTKGPKLHLYQQFDNFSFPPMFLLSKAPNMLPTKLLRDVKPQDQDGNGQFEKRDSSAQGLRWKGAVFSVVGAVVISLGVLTL